MITVTEMASELNITEAAIRKRIALGQFGDVERPGQGKATRFSHENLAEFLGSEDDVDEFVAQPTAFILSRADSKRRTPREWRTLLAAADLVEAAGEAGGAWGTNEVVGWRFQLNALRGKLKGIDAKADSSRFLTDAPTILHKLAKIATDYQA